MRLRTHSVHFFLGLVAALCGLSVAACSGPASSSGRAIDAGAATQPSLPVNPPAPAATATARPESPRAPRIEAQAGDHVHIEAGQSAIGSVPGTPHRRPSVEADMVPTAVPSFDIDRLPFPNDPSRPTQLAATRAEAAASCAADGRRLCHELEWERACRGDGVDSFPTGDTIDLATCAADPASCASPTGVMGLGISAPEWTATTAEPALARLERTAVVRGARPDDGVHLHRCGSRQVKNPAGGGRALAFRCCGGEAPTLAYPDIGERRLFRELEHDAQRWREIMSTIEPLAAYAEAFQPYGETEALRALARGDAAEAQMQWELARAPFAWSPSPGEEVWVVAGSSGASTILAAIYPLPDGTFSHAASFVLADEVAPVAILRTRTTRNELIWSTCWSCMGETGVFRFDEDATIRIVQQ